MDLYAESKTISDLFPVTKKTVFNIPIYQRNYSWKAENVETLFMDIVRENAGYYVGNLLITSNDSDENYMDVVDGQQRLTTISLFLIGIYYHLKKAKQEINTIEDSYIEDVLYEATVFIRKHLKIDKDGPPRLHLLDMDQITYNGLMEILDGDIDDYTLYKNRIMGKRFREILDLISGEFFKDGYDEESLKELLDFYHKTVNVEILRIKVESLTDAFSIFTSFNAKGLPLTLIDLLKSYYLKQAYKSNITNGNDKWNKLLSYFYDSNQETNSPLVTQFLQNNYDTFENDNKNSTSSITKSRALKTYDRLFESKGESYINDLIARAMIFSSFTNNIGQFNDKLHYSDKMIEYLNKISKLEATMVYPIMFYTLNEYKDNKIEDDEMEDILDFLYRYYNKKKCDTETKIIQFKSKGFIEC